MKITYSIIVISLCLLLLPSTVPAASAEKEVKEGNRLYNQGKYDDALAKYGSARTELSDSDIVNFNIGTAMYKKGDFQNAIDAFTKALVTEDKELEARANYNIANSKYKLGNLKVNTDLSGAVNLYREALDYYKRAIELNQSDTDSRYNHELVEKKLKALLDRLKNQPEQKDRKKETQEQSKAQQDRQSTPESGEEQQKEEQSGTEKQEEKNQKEKEEAGDQETQAQQPDTGEKAVKEEGKAAETGSEEETGKMSPEEARMLLEAYGQEEAIQMKQGRHGYYDKALKDW